VFILDSSGSIDRIRFDIIKEMVIANIYELDVSINRTRVGLIYWSNSAFIAFNLNDYGQVKQDMVEAIRRIPFIGNTTNTASALRLLHSTAFQPRNGDRPDVQNIAVLVGDGNSNVSPELTPVEAATCRTSGIRMIVAVVIDDQTDVAELSTIASRPLSDNLFMGLPEHLFDNITGLLIGSTCNVTGLLLLFSLYCVLALHSRAYGARSHLATMALDLLRMPPASSEFPGTPGASQRAEVALAKPHDHL